MSSAGERLAVAGELVPGQQSLGTQGVQHTLDAMRYGDLRPTLHTAFGGRLELAYTVCRSLEIAVAGYRGRSHFKHDTGYEKGVWRDSDWTVDVGPNFRIGEAGRTVILVGGAFVYGEAQSRLSVRDALGSYPFEGPETFMVGGTSRLLITRPLLWRFEGTAQLEAGVVKAHAKAPTSGNLYGWNGHSFSAALGIRTTILRGRQSVP